MQSMTRWMRSLAAFVLDAVREIEIEIPGFAFVHLDPFSVEIKFNLRTGLHRDVNTRDAVFDA
jgi:hypothetical protein